VTFSKKYGILQLRGEKTMENLTDRLKRKRQEKIEKLIYSRYEIKRNYSEGDVCKYGKDINELGYCKAYMTEIFPDDCLNAFEYGLIIQLWREKKNYKDIPLGECHYDFDTVIFYNTPAGYLVFKKQLLATVFKKYLPEALRVLEIDNIKREV